jgi:hypothetical protein
MLLHRASAGAKIPCRERVRIYEIDHLAARQTGSKKALKL